MHKVNDAALWLPTGENMNTKHEKTGLIWRKRTKITTVFLPREDNRNIIDSIMNRSYVGGYSQWLAPPGSLRCTGGGCRAIALSVGNCSWQPSPVRLLEPSSVCHSLWAQNVYLTFLRLISESRCWRNVRFLIRMLITPTAQRDKLGDATCDFFWDLHHDPQASIRNLRYLGQTFEEIVHSSVWKSLKHAKSWDSFH